MLTTPPPPAQASRTSILLRVLMPLLLFVVLANLPFWFASRSFGLVWKGIFDVEFLLVGIVSLFVSRRTTAFLLVTAMGVDLLSGISVTYLFTASEALRSSRWIAQFVPRHGAGIVVLALLILLPVLLALFMARPPANTRPYIAGGLAVLLASCVSLDIGTGQAAAFWHTDRQLGMVRLSRTPLRSLIVMNAQQTKTEGWARRSHFVALDAPSASLPSLLPMATASQAGSRPNIVLVLAESWGQPNDPDLDNALVQPFEDPILRERYIVHKGTVPFRGATIDGAARELCGSTAGFSLLDASAPELAACLPVQTERLGYRTIGVHGFTGRMYDRFIWWKTIGFEERWFMEQLQTEGLPNCPGPFPGICDAALARWIGGKLEQPSDHPSFLYWVTLNSHLPVPIPNQVAHPASCSAVAVTSQSESLCSWFQLIVDTQRSVAALALRLSSRPSIFLIVGDHQPPFATPTLRNQFSDKVVPFVLLVPRNMAPQNPLPPSIATLTPPPANVGTERAP